MKQLPSLAPLDTLVGQFAAKYPRFDSKPGSKGACKFVSYELTKYLLRRGVQAKLYHLEGVVPKSYPRAHSTWLEKDPKEWSHYVVKVGNLCYDMTMRQFDPDAPQPFVCSINDLRQTWTLVESDSFLNGLAAEFCQAHS